jgi:hypothetical protein
MRYFVMLLNRMFQAMVDDFRLRACSNAADNFKRYWEIRSAIVDVSPALPSVIIRHQRLG